MPSMVEKTSGAIGYASPFVGEPKDILHVKVDVSARTSDEVDSDGYLKAGVPLTSDGLLIGASNTKRVGIVVEPVKIVAAGTTLSGVTADPFVACSFTCAINRDAVEDNLGRALSANEIAGLNGAASNVVLSLT